MDLFARHWTTEPAYAKLIRAGIQVHHDPTAASNQWTVAPERSATGDAWLLIDPHLPWAGPGRLYEFRLHAGSLNLCGFSVLGTPFMILGHNRNVGWACTTGGPDCADVYQVVCTDDRLADYLFDGVVRAVTRTAVELDVAAGKTQTKERRELLATHHGPVVAVDGRNLYAVRTAYEQLEPMIRQLDRMSRATCTDEFRAALDVHAFIPQNIMYAGTDGCIGYRRCGRPPVRPPDADWRLPLAGNTVATEWQAIHGPEDLCQIENPVCGWMQNCNVAVDAMFPGHEFTRKWFPAWILNPPLNPDNARGRRCRRLLDRHTLLTAEQALDIAFDVTVDEVPLPRNDVHDPWTGTTERWLPVDDLLGCLARDAVSRSAVANLAAELLRRWNRRMTADSVAATVFYSWWQALCSISAPWTAETACACFRQACQTLQARYGTIEVPWGQIHRIGRPEQPDRHYPVDGVVHGRLMTLWPVRCDPVDEHGLIRAVAGSCGMLLIRFSDPIVSTALQPWGQNDDPGNVHFDDQARELMSARKLRPTHFHRHELMAGDGKNIESQRSLQWNPVNAPKAKQRQPGEQIP